MDVASARQAAKSGADRDIRSEGDRQAPSSLQRRPLPEGHGLALAANRKAVARVALKTLKKRHTVLPSKIGNAHSYGGSLWDSYSALGGFLSKIYARDGR